MRGGNTIVMIAELRSIGEGYPHAQERLKISDGFIIGLKLSKKL